VLLQEQVLHGQPDNAEDYYDLGLVCAKSSRFRESIKAFKQAILIKPDHAAAHYNLAITHLILKDRDAALQEYNVLKIIDQEKAIRLYDLIQM